MIPFLTTMDKTIRDKYSIGIDELNYILPVSVLSAIESTDDRAVAADRITEDVVSYLIRAYKEGAQATAIMLGIEVEADFEKTMAAVYLMIEDKTVADRIYEYVLSGDMSALQTLVNSEYHRVYNTGGYDAAEDFVTNGGNTEKKWRTMLDDVVRDTHDYLEGMTVAFDEEFFTYDGDSARFPGDFSDPANNVNCRCFIEYVIKP